MATVLDLGLVQSFDVIYPVLLVFALLFSLLHKTKILGESTAFNAIISAVVGFMILLSRTVIDIINFMVPWFIIAAIFFLLVLLLFNIFGAREGDVLSYIQSDKGVGWTIVGISVIIFIAAIANVIGQDLTEASFQEGTTVSVNGSESTATSSFDTNIQNIFFHPKILGFATLFIIVIFAVGLLTGNFGPK